MAYLGYSIAGSLDFDVNLEITCDLTSLDALTINPMTFTIFESSDIQILPYLTDSVGVLKANNAFCGDRVYSVNSISPSLDYTDFFTLDSASRTLTLGKAESTYGDEGTYTIEVLVSLQDYPAITAT